MNERGINLESGFRFSMGFYSERKQLSNDLEVNSLTFQHHFFIMLCCNLIFIPCKLEGNRPFSFTSSTDNAIHLCNQLNSPY